MNGVTIFFIVFVSIIIYAIISRICECIENIVKEDKKEKIDE